MISRILIGICLLGTMLSAQEKPAPPRVSRLVPVQHLRGMEFNRVRNMLDAFGASVKGDESMHVFAVSGTEDMVNAVEQAIKKLDVAPPAPKNLELTFFIVLGSSHAGGEAPKMAADLEPVLKQLRGVFPYTNYRILDTQLARTRARSERLVNTSGMLPGLNNGDTQRFYDITFEASVDESPKGNTIRLEPLRFNSRMGPTGKEDVRLDTVVDIKEGQKVVVGKSTFAPDSALFLVIMAKVVD